MLCVLWPRVSHAYVGPGAGLGMLGALAAMIAVVSTSVGVLVVVPLRRWWRRIRGGAEMGGGDAERDPRADHEPAPDEVGPST